jgi:hypothetical protein
VAFWSDKLDMARDDVRALVADPVALRARVRAGLMKRGGVGYVQPGRESFPLEGEFNAPVVASGALPCAGWLDGGSEGEQAAAELLELHISKGVVALNMIPEYARKRPRDMVRVCGLARELDLPLNVGTEMNSLGQPLIDDFEAPVYAPVRQQFLDGAHFIYGHVIMERALGLGYQSAWAQSHLPARRDRNGFYRQVGECVPPGRAIVEVLGEIDTTLAPPEMLGLLRREFG